MSLKVLKKQVKALNKLKLADEIDLDQDESELQEEFISTIEEIDDDNKTGEVDDKILDFYESLIGDEDDEDEEEEKPKKKTNKSKAKPKAKPKKKAKDEDEDDDDDDDDEDEDEDDDEDEEEEKPKKKTKKVVKKKVVKKTKKKAKDEDEDEEEDDDDEDDDEDDDDEDEDDEKPKKKGKGKKPGNFTPQGSVPITEAAAKAIKKFKGKKVDILKVSKLTNSIRVDAGGKDNVGTSGYYVKFAIKVLTELGHCKVDGKKVTFS